MSPMKRDHPPDPHVGGTLSLSTLARRWNTTPKEIRRMLARQELGFVLIGRRLRVPQEEVAKYEREH